MLKSIVAHETKDRNTFDSFTEADHTEYEAWLDAKAQWRDPQPCDFDGIYQEQYEYDRWKDEASDEEFERAKRQIRVTTKIVRKYTLSDYRTHFFRFCS